MKIKNILLLAVAVIAFASCEVEFSPNAKWKEVPVVYCVIDQDDDTTWARVEKCYLADGDIYSYGQTSDSINYPQGAIQVELLEFKDGGSLNKTYTMQYTEVDRETGDFASQSQPVYYCITAGMLNENYTYKIKVTGTSDGHQIALSQPVTLIKKNQEKAVISKPTTTGAFGFYDSPGNGSKAAFCKIQWPALEGARLYEPVVRFYYTIGTDTLYKDLKCGTVKGNSSLEYSYYYPRQVFLEDLKEALKDDPRPKHCLRKVDIFLTACSEELNAYMNTVGSGSMIEQTHQVYTNIDGGEGVVATRRTHLYKTVPADSSLINNKGLLYFLINLGVGLS